MKTQHSQNQKWINNKMNKKEKEKKKANIYPEKNVYFMTRIPITVSEMLYQWSSREHFFAIWEWKNIFLSLSQSKLKRDKGSNICVI